MGARPKSHYFVLTTVNWPTEQWLVTLPPIGQGHVRQWNAAYGLSGIEHSKAFILRWTNRDEKLYNRLMLLWSYQITN